MISKSLTSVLLGTALFSSLLLQTKAQVTPAPSASPSPAPSVTPSAQPPGGEHHWVHPGPEEMMSRYLQLTDDQKKQIKPIVDEAAAKGKQLLEDTKQKVRAILTPDQQAKLDALPAPLGTKKGGWPHFGGMSGGGMPGEMPHNDHGMMGGSSTPPIGSGTSGGEVFRAPMMPNNGPHMTEAQAFQTITEGLNLSPEQKAKVSDLVKSQESEIRSIEDKAHTDVASIVNNAKIAIVPILTPAQLQIIADKAKLEADEAAVLMQGVNKK